MIRDVLYEFSAASMPEQTTFEPHARHDSSTTFMQHLERCSSKSMSVLFFDGSLRGILVKCGRSAILS